ncbi:ABC transporter ATP-binding protein [Balneolales bacterium ANBcel1]|nr:ABC transporter ATP-binding protein [Balneolales bacterium ANBcel1]
MITAECHELGKRFGKTIVFRGVNLRFEGPAVIGIQGANGSGKSTLLKCLSGLLRPSEGRVTWHIRGKQVKLQQIRYQIGFTAPHIQMYHDLTVSENLSFLQRVRPALPEPEIPHFADSPDRLAAVTGIGHLADQPYGTLSSGQQQRVRLAGALVSAPPVLMLDEPGTNLDRDGIALVNDIIIHQKNAGGMVFLASNRQEELDLCERIVDLQSLSSTDTRQVAD